MIKTPPFQWIPKDRFGSSSASAQILAVPMGIGLLPCTWGRICTSLVLQREGASWYYGTIHKVVMVKKITSEAAPTIFTNIEVVTRILEITIQCGMEIKSPSLPNQHAHARGFFIFACKIECAESSGQCSHAFFAELVMKTYRDHQG